MPLSTMTTCPAILVAAPASGQGKTTVVSALARLHTRQGQQMRVFKCGPDLLHPHWHTLASGTLLASYFHACFASCPEAVKELFARPTLAKEPSA